MDVFGKNFLENKSFLYRVVEEPGEGILFLFPYKIHFHRKHIKYGTLQSHPA